MKLETIIAVSPSFCNNCTSVFTSESISRLRYFSCDAGLCPHCVTQNDLDAAKAVLKNIAPICDECMWTFDNPARNEETHEEFSSTIPPKSSSQPDDYDNAMDKEAMIEMDEEVEDDIPLIIDPIAASKELVENETMFPDDNVFESINTMIISINSQEVTITLSSVPRISPAVSPEKSKSASSTPKPSVSRVGAKPMVPPVGKKYSGGKNCEPTRKIKHVNFLKL